MAQLMSRLKALEAKVEDRHANASRTATIQTAKIELSTIQVSGKQLTLAVFRQLPKASVMSLETGEFVGEPWGTVNYFWKDCCTCRNEYRGLQPTHLHVVWSDGERLYLDGNFSGLSSGLSGILREVWDENRETLLRLPQLYIAV